MDPGDKNSDSSSDSADSCNLNYVVESLHQYLHHALNEPCAGSACGSASDVWTTTDFWMFYVQFVANLSCTKVRVHHWLQSNLNLDG